MSKVLQFKVVLIEISPPIWRRIQVPEEYTFWDLHVAIQDSMGWTDSHLHMFIIHDPKKGRIEIGIPDPDGELDILPGWRHKINKHFRNPGDRLVYEYDFGDSWRHAVLLEQVSLAEPDVAYPCCIDGERRCPPEDCGSIPGFERFLEAIADPNDEEHEGFLEWCGGSFDPDDFDPKDMKFDDPGERMESLFQG